MKGKKLKKKKKNKRKVDRPITVQDVNDLKGLLDELVPAASEAKEIPEENVSVPEVLPSEEAGLFAAGAETAPEEDIPSLKEEIMSAEGTEEVTEAAQTAEAAAEETAEKPVFEQTEIMPEPAEEKPEELIPEEETEFKPAEAGPVNEPEDVIADLSEDIPAEETIEELIPEEETEFKPAEAEPLNEPEDVIADLSEDITAEETSEEPVPEEETECKTDEAGPVNEPEDVITDLSEDIPAEETIEELIPEEETEFKPAEEETEPLSEAEDIVSEEPETVTEEAGTFDEVPAGVAKELSQAGEVLEESEEDAVSVLSEEDEAAPEPAGETEAEEIKADVSAEEAVPEIFAEPSEAGNEPAAEAEEEEEPEFDIASLTELGSDEGLSADEEIFKEVSEYAGKMIEADDDILELPRPQTPPEDALSATTALYLRVDEFQDNAEPSSIPEPESKTDAQGVRHAKWIHHIKEDPDSVTGIYYLPQRDCSYCGYTSNNYKKICPLCRSIMDLE